MIRVYFNNINNHEWYPVLWNYFIKENDNRNLMDYKKLYDSYGIEILWDTEQKFKENINSYELFDKSLFNKFVLSDTINYFGHVIYGIIIHNEHKLLLFKMKYG